MKADILRKAVVTGLGTGYLRPAPGSWGSLAVCVVFLALVWASVGAVVVNVVMVVLAVGATVGCVALGDFAQEAFGRKDPGHCTLDEWAGQAVSLLGLPLGSGWGQRLIAVGTAFFCFRLFDSRLIQYVPQVISSDGYYYYVGTSKSFYRLRILYLLDQFIGTHALHRQIIKIDRVASVKVSAFNHPSCKSLS